MDFNNLIKETHRIMMEEHHAVNDKKNPVAFSLDLLSTRELQHILCQYAIFSRKIVSFLVDAYYVLTFSGWEEVKKEVFQNISEEFGKDSGSEIPHYVLLRRGFQNVMGINLSQVPVGDATQEFITSIHNTLAMPDPAFSTGGIYALESTATPELVMTYKFTRELLRRCGAEENSEIQTFFLSHINEVEVLHEGRLREACERYLQSDLEKDSFKKGFIAVMKIMDRWWENLYSESYALKGKCA